MSIILRILLEQLYRKVYILTKLLSSMKTLNITFTDREFIQLKKSKDSKPGNRNWHHFIMGLVRKVMKGGKDDGKNKSNK